MAITRTDETELLTALHDGMHETPRWATFLDRLRRRTRADYVSMIFRQANMPMHRATELFSGRDLHAAARGLTDLALLDPIPYDRLRPARVYGLEELIDPQDARHARFLHDYLDRIGVRQSRFMRVAEPGGTSLWTTLSRDAPDFTAADSALLAALAPHLVIALRTFASLERERFRAGVMQDALTRAGIAWIALDAEAEPIEAGPAAAGLRAARHNRAVTSAATAFAADPAMAPRAIMLESAPPIALLAVAPPAPPPTAVTPPAMIALAREATMAGPASAAALMQLYQLTASEARLALALAAGLSLAEAAPALRLTVATARNYSKRIFLKTGTSGQVQLVRLILTGVATLA